MYAYVCLHTYKPNSCMTQTVRSNTPLKQIVDTCKLSACTKEIFLLTQNKNRTMVQPLLNPHATSVSCRSTNKIKDGALATTTHVKRKRNIRMGQTHAANHHTHKKNRWWFSIILNPPPRPRLMQPFFHRFERYDAIIVEQNPSV